MKDYLFPGGTPNRTSCTDEEIKFPLKVKWKSKIGGHLGNPVIGADKIIFSKPNHISLGKTSVIALNANNGKLLWEITPEGSVFIQENICLYNDVVYFSNGETIFAVRGDNGEILWTLKDAVIKGGSKESGNGVMVYKERLYINGHQGLSAINPQSGKVIWSFKSLNIGIPSISNDKIVVGDFFYREGGNLYCIHAMTGELIWKKDVSKIGEYYRESLSKMREEDVVVQGVICSRFPIIAECRLFASLDKYLCCFALENGEVIWKAESRIKDPIYKNKRLFGFDGWGFYCHNAETGDLLFEKKHNDGSISYSLPFFAGNIFLAGNVLGLFAYDIATGELIWTNLNKRKHGGYVSQPLFIDGRLYAGNSASNEYIYCFENKKE